MSAFSIEKVSMGSPCICHSRILTGSPSVPISEYVFDTGMYLSRHNLIHCLMQSLFENILLFIFISKNKRKSKKFCYLSVVKSKRSQIGNHRRGQKHIADDVVVRVRQFVYLIRPSSLLAAQAVNQLLRSFDF